MFLKTLIFFFILILVPTTVFADSLTKKEACSYPDGIHGESVYVLWPKKLPYVEEFLKKDGFLYYFIHTFPDRDSLSAYQDARGGGGYIRNTGSFFVSFDCARSKVKFLTNVRSLGGTAYGKLNWIDGRYLSYSLVGEDRDPCTIGPDALLDMVTMTNLRLDRLSGLPRSTTTKCVGRSPYKSIDQGVVQFDIEEHTWATEESFYSRYQYSIPTKKLRKIR